MLFVKFNFWDDVISVIIVNLNRLILDGFVVVIFIWCVVVWLFI